MLVVPTQASPSQTFQVTLAQQQVNVAIQQTDYGLFMSVELSGTPIATGIICQDLNLIVRAAYTGFSGDLAFYDTSGEGLDPVYTGLGSRYQLLYLEAADL